MDRSGWRIILTSYLCAAGAAFAAVPNRSVEPPPPPDFEALKLAVFSGRKGPKLNSGGMADIYAAQPGVVFKIPRMNLHPHGLMMEIMGHVKVSDALANSEADEMDTGREYLMEVLGIARLARPWWRWFSKTTPVPRIIFTLEEGGVSLWELRNKLSTFEAMAMIGQVSQALAFLHKRDLAHLDVKPDNILTATGGRMRVMLGDFGFVARVRDTIRGRGTHPYLPPELINSRLASRKSAESRVSVQPSADIFSLMVTACELITGGDEPFENSLALDVAASKDLLDDDEMRRFLVDRGYDLTGLPDNLLRQTYLRARMRLQVEEIESGPSEYGKMTETFGGLYALALHHDPIARPSAQTIAEKINHFIDFHYGARKVEDGSATLPVKVDDAVVLVPFDRTTTIEKFRDSLFLIALREKPGQAVRSSAIARLVIKNGAGEETELSQNFLEVADGMGLLGSDGYVCLELTPDCHR